MSKLVRNTGKRMCRACGYILPSGRLVAGKWYCIECARKREEQLEIEDYYSGEDTEY